MYYKYNLPNESQSNRPHFISNPVLAFIKAELLFFFNTTFAKGISSVFLAYIPQESYTFDRSQVCSF